MVEDHFFTNKYVEKVPESLKPLYAEKWKIAQNLQYLAQGAIEPLVSEFTKDLVIYSGFIHAGRNNNYNMSPHGTGEAVDIFVDGWDINMFHLVGEIMKMVKNRNVCEIGLCFNQRSWIHLGIVGANHMFNGNVTKPRFFTRDFATGQAWSGFFPARGLMR